MDSLVLDAQASDLRTELLKERKKRFEVEEKLRFLEQQLSTRTPSRTPPAQTDSKRSDAGTDVTSNADPASSGSAIPYTVVNAASIAASGLDMGESTASFNSSPRRSEVFDLEAERDWINSVMLPGASLYPKSRGALVASTGGSDSRSARGEEVEQDKIPGDANLASGGLGSDNGWPSGNGSQRYQSLNRDGLLAGSGLLSSSPTVNGFVLVGDAKTSTLTSSVSASEVPKRKYDDATLKLSHARLELKEYRQVLAETAAQLSQAKNRAEFLEVRLNEQEESVALLREQVREKNKKIMVLMEDNKAVEALRKEFDETAKSRITLQVKLDACLRAHQLTSESEASLRQQVELLTTQLKSKDGEIMTKEQLMNKMAEKLMELKNQLQLMVPHLCKFSVSTVSRFGKAVVASLGVLKPNAQKHSSRELEIVISGKRTTHPANTVLSIAPSSNNPERFTITYRNGNTDMFDSQRRTELLKEINAHLFTHGTDNAATTNSEAQSSKPESS